MAGMGLTVAVSACRTRERIPDYLPREVVANQVGGAVVYELNDPRRAMAQTTPAVMPAVSQSVGRVSVPVTNAGISAPGTALPPVTSATGVSGEAKSPIRRTLQGQPEGVAVTENGLREATITWIAPVGEVYRYRIERSESPSGPFEKVEEVAPRRIQYRDAGTSVTPLRDSTTYYYQLVAVLDREGPESIPSKIVKTVTAPPPATPAGVTAVASGSRAVKVNWSLSPSVGVTGYYVERALAPVGTFERVGIVPSPPLVDGGTAASSLKDSSTYHYRVTAMNRVKAESAPSAPVEVTTLPPPVVVKNVKAVSDEVRCVPLSWAPSPEPDVVRYDVYRSRLGAGPFLKIGLVNGRTGCAYLDGGANPGNLEDESEYHYRIRAINAVTSESADSETVRAATCGVPGEVGSVTATAGRPRAVPVAWAANTGKAVVGYEIWRAKEGDDDWVQAGRVLGRGMTNFLDRGEVEPRPGLGSLMDGTVYQYKVIAFNQANVRSSASSAASARTKLRPAAPAELQASTNQPLAIRLSWKPNAENDISEYVVECSDDPTEDFRKLTTVVPAKDIELVAIQRALPSGVFRFYRVKAIDKDGLESDWCRLQRGRAKTIPGKPGSVAAQLQGASVRVTWTAPVQTDVRRYRIWRKKFISWEPVSITDQTNYLFELNAASKSMTIAITAVDQDELESDKSEPVEIKSGP
jgi:fibronectin type 3 domain-containing protein